MSSLVPAVPDFDRCSDPHNYRDTVDHGTVPAVPDFDRCSDLRCAGTSQPGRSGPSSSRLRSVLRRESVGAAPVTSCVSQQFPTSIGAQTGEAHSCLERSHRVPAVPDFDRCSDEDPCLRTAVEICVPAVPDFDRCSDQAKAWDSIAAPVSQQFPTSIGAQTRLKGGRRSRTMVPAVPDFDRCSDRRWRAYRSSRPRVPAVPDFDRCTDHGQPPATR